MDSTEASSQFPLATPKKKTLPSSSTPIKGSSAVLSHDQFWTPTPEKPTQLSRHGRSRNVVLSMKEVRQAALGLRKKDRGADSADRDLALLEEQLRADRAVKSSPSKLKNQIKLPEKYQILCEIFNSMECSIRLLRLKGSMATFSNLYGRIQDMANQNFTYTQLAQMKHILPEAIMIKKVLLRDEITCCMKPDLQIILNAESIGINMKKEGQNAYLQLRKVFRQRLVDFVQAHPEADDVPEEELPHPFNKSNMLSTPKIISKNIANDKPESVVLSHMSPSFQRRFFQKATISKEKGSLLNPSSSSDSPKMFISALEATPVKRCTSGFEVTPAKEQAIASEATPAKHVSTPVRLMAATPEMGTPKRCLSESCVDSPPVKKLASKRSARSLLFMSPNKSIKETDEIDLDETSEEGVLDFLPKSLLQSVKEKEMRLKVEKETGVADAIKRQRMIRCLPSTFNTILLIYRSMKRSIITKQELIHKIIANNAKIVDREEVEEQIRLFLELVPEWISEKTALGGDVLIRVDMLCSPQEIRDRLVRAE
ncbi:CDT1-like protein A [Rhynchospora pubera]|uniref:CDT1-like protein A n=1 Tax=Rhynchospora pubera TaxID=906938 RepID=A0AAV8CYE4_9POAL|nr:CDT1-like protein A [Rhynchospora pubera]